MNTRLVIIFLLFVLGIAGVYYGITVYQPHIISQVQQSDTLDIKPPNVLEKVALGKRVFDEYCVHCHGTAAQGKTKDWKKRLPNGRYPPPPLNGTAHTWHHSLASLLQTINQGTASLGGQMPAFENRLTEQEKQAVLYYLYHLWPEHIQNFWTQRFGTFDIQLKHR